MMAGNWWRIGTPGFLGDEIANAFFGLLDRFFPPSTHNFSFLYDIHFFNMRCLFPKAFNQHKKKEPFTAVEVRFVNRE